MCWDRGALNFILDNYLNFIHKNVKKNQNKHLKSNRVTRREHIIQRDILT